MPKPESLLSLHDDGVARGGAEADVRTAWKYTPCMSTRRSLRQSEEKVARGIIGFRFFFGRHYCIVLQVAVPDAEFGGSIIGTGSSIREPVDASWVSPWHNR